MVRSFLEPKAGREAGKVSPRWVRLHTASPGQRRARGHGWGCGGTAPFVTAAINIPLQNATDMCPSEGFTANNVSMSVIRRRPDLTLWCLSSVQCVSDLQKITLKFLSIYGFLKFSPLVPWAHLCTHKTHTVQLSAWCELSNTSDWLPHTNLQSLHTLFC